MVREKLTVLWKEQDLGYTYRQYSLSDCNSLYAGRGLICRFYTWSMCKHEKKTRVLVLKYFSPYWIYIKACKSSTCMFWKSVIANNSCIKYFFNEYSLIGSHKTQFFLKNITVDENGFKENCFRDFFSWTCIRFKYMIVEKFIHEFKYVLCNLQTRPVLKTK